MTLVAPDFAKALLNPSPNFGARLGCDRPDMIILHYTGMESGQGAEAWLCSPESQVSSHYLVHEDGRVVQMVAEANRAWHAGKSFWAGETDINSRSVGIEIVNPGHSFGYPPFPLIQINAVIALCRDIATRHGIVARRILAHSDVAPGRKIDPGEKFPWHILHAAGVGHWVEPEEPDAGEPPACVEVLEVQQLLASYGYDIAPTGVFDERTRVVIEAFQRHFRTSRVDGIPDWSTVMVLKKILRGV